jgi:hypothetical protein
MRLYSTRLNARWLEAKQYVRFYSGPIGEFYPRHLSSSNSITTKPRSRVQILGGNFLKCHCEMFATKKTHGNEYT